MKRRGGIRAAAPEVQEGVQLICVRDLMRFVDILELYRLLGKMHGRAVLVAMTPCLVDAIAEPMLAGLPHAFLHTPFDSQRVEEAVQRMKRNEGALVVVEVACPEDAVRVLQGVEATGNSMLVASADLRQAFLASPLARPRPRAMRYAQVAL